jgi:hypothetical protein
MPERRTEYGRAGAAAVALAAVAERRAGLGGREEELRDFADDEDFAGLDGIGASTRVR